MTDIVYALVAKQGPTLLAEYTTNSGNFNLIALSLLKSIDTQEASPIKHMVQHEGGYTFYYLVADGVVYMCLSVAAAKVRVSFAFLEDVQKCFTQEFTSTHIQRAITYEMNKAFKPVLKARMTYYNTSDSDEIQAIKNQLGELKDVMISNLESLIDRGERLDLLVVQTEQLDNVAFTFERGSGQLRHQMWWKKFSMYIALGVGLLVGGMVLYFVVK